MARKAKHPEATKNEAMKTASMHSSYFLASLAGDERESHETDLNRWFPKRDVTESGAGREARLAAAADTWAACRVLWLDGQDPAALLRPFVHEAVLRVALERTSEQGPYPGRDSGRLYLDAYSMLRCLKKARSARRKGIDAATAAALKERAAQWEDWGVREASLWWREEREWVPIDLQGRAFMELRIAPTVDVLATAITKIVASRGRPSNVRLLSLVREVRPGIPDKEKRLEDYATKARARMKALFAQLRGGAWQIAGQDSTALMGDETERVLRQPLSQGDQQDALPQNPGSRRVPGRDPAADTPGLADCGAGPEVRKNRKPHFVRHAGPRRVSRVTEVQQHRRGTGSRAPHRQDPEGEGGPPCGKLKPP